MRVTAHNADQPNSRWYSGAGIYREVWLWEGEKEHICINGVKVKTKSIQPAVIEIEVDVTGKGEVTTEIFFDDSMIYTQKKEVDEKVSYEIQIPDANLWSVESPNLYRCKVSYGNDEVCEFFGIRTIDYNRKKGFCINGDRVIIRGACIHHDNGILGACAYAAAEKRKIKILQDAGYNAIRSAHNPCSKAMLDACDELGMMVMDEYTDMWYIHKTMYDYASYCKEWYRQDIKDMIEKDYNHPSVIMYSLGNEVGETANREGADFFASMRAVCNEYDGTRPVTCGVNILFNLMYSMGFGVYSDEKAKENPEKSVGSEFFNNIAGIFGNYSMKIGATLHGCDVKTRESFAEMDVAGYNYGILRYKHDLKKYPKRLILGSETFCEDANKFYQMAKKEPGIIGDFVWAGMDYLGEIGIGAWEYSDYAPDFKHDVGWISAGSGRVDLTGKLTAEALYTRTAFELETNPMIAVVPVNHTNDKHSPSAWKYTNAIPSWSWNEMDGNDAQVEVYSQAYRMELYLNKKLIGAKNKKKDCRYLFKTKYQDGELEAVAYNKAGTETGRSKLVTAGKETILSLIPEQTNVKKGDLCFIRLQYTDKKGNVKPLTRGRIEVTVSGGKLLGIGHACPFNPDGYRNDWTETYYGEALAIVKVEEQLHFSASSKFGKANVEIGCDISGQE